MTLIDTHCHLAHGRLCRQVPAVMERALAAGVKAVICAAGDLRESKAALELARGRREVFSTAGLHPHEAKAADERYIEVIGSLAAEPGNVAVGEIGLDYHYDHSPRPDQRRVFAEQLDLARRLGKPVMIHTREAFEDTLAILGESGIDGRQVVFHSFTGGPAEARKALDIGAVVSFSGIVTFKGAQDVRQAAMLVPADRIVIETDGPYLAPEPVRKMWPNEPANVAHVAARLAAIRGAKPEDFAELATANAIRFFHLDKSTVFG